ncbi:MAG: hypothetical protein HC872_02795 [Gammaproteobacteria bacterium]|nr:hypothetical protein [Gammaproteobacteria bacterium]
MPARSALLAGAGDGNSRRWPAPVQETSPGNLLWARSLGHDALPGAPGVVALVADLLAGST